MISACVVPTVKHGGGVMVWGCLLVTLSVIYLAFKAHLTSIATAAFCSEAQSHLVCPKWDNNLVFNRTMNQNTPPGCVRAIWQRRRVMECCIRLPDLHSIEMVWVELDASPLVLSRCGNSFKTVYYMTHEQREHPPIYIDGTAVEKV